MSKERDTNLDDFGSRFEVRPNNDQFTPAEALAEAKILKRHLEQWHVPDRDSSPVKWAKFVEAERMKRVTFREEATKGEHNPRCRTVQVFIPGLIAGDDGAVLENHDRLTDHSVTLWLVREFYERLTRLRKNAHWQYLAITFDRLLDEPCYVYRQPDPKLDYEFEWAKPGWWSVVGKPVPIDLLGNFVEAATMVVSHSLYFSGEAPKCEPLTKPEDDAGCNAAKGKHIDERMAKTLLNDPSSVDWTVDEWKLKFGCSKSTVADSSTWKKIMTMRKLREVEQFASKHYKPDKKAHGQAALGR